MIGSSQVGAQYARRTYRWRERDAKSAPEPAGLIMGANTAVLLLFVTAGGWVLHAFSPLLEPPSILAAAVLCGVSLLVGAMISFERIWSFG
ncbi:MAG: hypothetical protein M3072_05045 [Candidatus Dormibacteraeota bacterium]|nr:hypothetical protein [Candidatus Dormibacteraeota bacterium]